MNEDLLYNTGNSTQYLWGKRKMVDKEFPGGPVSETPHSPMQAAWVLSLVKELDPICCN